MKYLLVLFLVIIFVGCKYTPSNNSNQGDKSIIHDTLSIEIANPDSKAFSKNDYALPVDTLPDLYKSIIENIIRLDEIKADIKKYPLEDKYNIKYKQLNLKTIALLDTFSLQDLNYKSKYLFNIYYYAESYEIESIRSTARKYLHPQDLLTNNKSGIIIDEEKWNNFRGYLRITEGGAVLSSSFEQVSNNQVDKNQYFRFPLETFYNSNNKKEQFLHNDTIIATMPNDGFENIKYVLTVWEKRGNKYYLLSILDKWLNVNIGRVWVDKVINIDSKTNILMGSSGGGDQGDTWGAIWIGLWEKPEKFKIIYQMNWCSSGSEPIYKSVDYVTSIDEEELIIEIVEITKKYKMQDNLSEQLIDSVRKVEIVDVKAIMNKDITREFNFGEL